MRERAEAAARQAAAAGEEAAAAESNTNRLRVCGVQYAFCLCLSLLLLSPFVCLGFNLKETLSRD